MSESITEGIFRKFYGVNTFIEKSAIPNEYGFKSKRGTDYKGYPDFFKAEDNFLIIVECKASIKSHQNAEDEVQYYMSNVCTEYNSVGIALSGQNHEELKISYFIQLRGSKKCNRINLVEFVKLDELKNVFDKLSVKINYQQLVDYANTLNDEFDGKFKLSVQKRPYFFAALLFALEKLSNFVSSYNVDEIKVESEESINGKKRIKTKVCYWSELSKKEQVDYINNLILEEVNKEFADKLTNSFKIHSIPSKFAFIGSENNSISSDSYLLFLKDFTKRFQNYKETVKYYDIIGSFYTKFLRYVQKAGGQDIILTPDHIKTFMCELLNIQSDDVILDTCTGSGGFIATAFCIILDKLEENGINTLSNRSKVKSKQLIAIEKDPDMFSLAFSNMVLHGDGKSNLYNGDCFENFEISYIDDDNNSKTIFIEDLIKKLKPTKGIINPPYNDDKSVNFIYRCLELLKIGKAGKTCCVIAPSNCLKKVPDVAKKILRTNRLEAVIDMNGKLFTNQKVANKTSIFIFKVGEKHLKDDKVYFYNFRDDDYYYTERKMYDKGSWDSLKKDVLQAVKDKTIIDGKSYLETINLDTLENALYIPKIKEELNMQQFIKTVVNYEIFQIREVVNGKV